MADELSAPLTRRSDRRRNAVKAVESRFAISRLPLARLAIAVIVLVVGVAVARVMLTDDPLGGRPSAEVPINSTRDANPIAEQIAAAPTVQDPNAPVTITVDPTTSGGPSITVIEDTPASVSPSMMSVGKRADGLIADLVEDSDNGPLPRIAADGTKPFVAYSQAGQYAAAAGRPMVAIILTGMGLHEQGTLSAIEALPPGITLAFAPYGRSLDTTVPAARAAGHELLLEVPLEPFDYPENDPGPETLLTGEAPRANIDRLEWLMSRFGGYVGLINNMGARFTASAADFSPVMEELGARGLGYVDDGSSNRSVAAQLAVANGVPFGRATMTIDDNPAPGPILSALDRLEAEAKADGTAIGIATALPVTITTLVEWARQLESRGVVLVPVSVLMKAGG